MASGHVNRIQRPNTWLHRPSLRREDSPCHLGAVHTWPSATLAVTQPFGRDRGHSRHPLRMPETALMTRIGHTPFEGLPSFPGKPAATRPVRTCGDFSLEFPAGVQDCLMESDPLLGGDPC